MNCGMNKAKAIELLGGSIASVAEAVGVSSQAVSQWPDPLPERIADRVLAALARKHLPAKMIGGKSPVQTAAKATAGAGSAAAGKAKAKAA